MPGYAVRTPARRLGRELGDRTGVPGRVANDAEVAHLGAFAGAPGVVVVAGTGSIALGRDADGRVRRAGGHGYLLGDEGGGYWLGAHAVRAALAARDGTGQPTILEQVLAEHRGTDLDRLVADVYRDPTDRRLLASLAPVVAAVSTHDSVAAQLLAAAADHLVALAGSVVGGLAAPIPVAPVGGAFAITAIRARFTAATSAVAPLEPPELGAVRLATGVAPGTKLRQGQTQLR